MGVDGEVGEAEVDPGQPEAKKEIKDLSTGDVIRTIFNPGVGKYDVRIKTGASYETQRQEAAEAMSQMAQGNPELWAVAGDLLVANMDWPGAEKLAERLKRTIDPKLLSDQPSPETQQMKQQMEQMGQQMQAMQQLLDNVQRSFEQQELDVKKFEAETKRIAATKEGMTPEQIQDTVMGTLHGAIDTERAMAAGRAGQSGQSGQSGQGQGQPMPMPQPAQPPQAALNPPINSSIAQGQ